MVHNEDESFEKLLHRLIEYKQPQDEIVVLDDYSDNEKTKAILDYFHSTDDIKLDQRSLVGDYATQKNYLKGMCTGDYTFNLDADEMISHWFMKDIHEILEGNEVDLIYVPRINTVEGFNQENIHKWGWRVDEKGWINWPDPQWRIYKKSDTMRWVNKVHEKIEGYDTISNLPSLEEFALLHPKDIKKQEKQNEYYDTLV